MAEIDQKHLERQQRKQTETLKTIIIILSVVAVALLGFLIYKNHQNNTLIGELNYEKKELTKQMIELRAEYDSLYTNYTDINLQLDSSKEQVNQLIDRINKTEATNRARIRQYEKELGTLRKVMRHYVVQIDSLNTLNKQLTEDAARARQEAAKVKKENTQMAQKLVDLSKKVQAGSVVKVRSISVAAQNKSGKTLGNPSSRMVAHLLTSMTLVENDLAPKGWMPIYLKVFGPDESLILPAGKDLIEFQCAGETMYASVSREVDYQGQEIDLSIYFNDYTFTKGAYRVEVYSQGGYLGKSEIVLR